MMQTLRKYMKHVMWIVAVTFVATIVFSWGLGGFNRRGMPTDKGIIGKINGHEITYQQFAATYTQEIEASKQESKTEDVSEYRRSAIREQVWQQIVRDVLFSEQINRHRLYATEEEIIFHLRNNPPEFLRSNEQFQTDGQFDMAKYQEALGNPRNFKAWIPVENYLRSTLPVLKLQQMVISTVRVTDEETFQSYRLENEKTNAKYLFFDSKTITLEGLQIPESELTAYYRDHQDEYKEPEKRTIRYILFENKPSADDSLQTRNDILDLMDQIRRGAKFENVAKENSEDAGTAPKGGDLGFGGPGTWVKPFEEAAFAAKPGEVVGPVQTPFGLHLIQVVEKKKGENQIHVRHILLKFKMSPETSDALNDRITYLSDEIQRTKGKGFDELAGQEKLAIADTPPFQKGAFIPGLGMASRVNQLAFQAKKDWVSTPVNAGENNVIFKVSSIQPSHIKLFADVRIAIESVLQREKQKDRSGDQCRRIREQIQTGNDFERVALENALPVMETGLFGLQGYLSAIGRDPEFTGQAFRLKVGEVSPPVRGEKGYYLIKALDRTTVDEKTFESIKESRKESLLQQKLQTCYAAWFNRLRDNAKISDYRDLYF